MKSHFLACCAVLIAGSTATAAVAQTPTTSPAAVLSPSKPNVLRAGLQIPLVMAEALTTEGKALRVGQRVNLATAEDVSLGGQVVIPKGSPATGELTDIRNKGMWGKSGRINGRVLFVRANGRQIRMTGTFDDKGVTGTGAVVAAVVFLPVVGFFTTGTSAKLPLGAAVTGFLDEDIEVAFTAASTPQPMQVPMTVTPK